MKRLVLVAVLLLVSCGQSGSAANPADCTKVTSIAASGRPAAALGADLLIPGAVTGVSGSVLPAGSGAEVPAGESTLAMPDPDVDRIVAVGRVTEMSGLRAEVEKMVNDRGWRVGGNSSSSDGRFSLEYQGPGISGSVVTLSCDEPMYLVSAEISPALPKDTTPFSCDRLRTSFSRADIRPGGVPGTCAVSEGDAQVQVTFVRPEVDPFRWRQRLQELRRNARDYAGMFCGPGAPVTATGEFIAQCTTKDAFGAKAATSAVRANDFWVGAQVELRNDDATTAQALMMGETVVRALTGS